MERVTISLEDELLDEFDRYIQLKGYENRSEAIRDLLRRRLEQDRLEQGQAEHVVACVSYVYNHHQRELTRRLTSAQHEHHDLALSTLHVHLDHENCLEVVVLQGPTPEVQRFAEGTVAETGVRHGNIHLIPAEMIRDSPHHGHDHGHAHPHAIGVGAEQPHTHTRPKT